MLWKTSFRFIWDILNFFKIWKSILSLSANSTFNNLKTNSENVSTPKVDVLKLRIYRSLKSLFVSNESERSFPQHCILSSTTLHSRSLPLIHGENTTPRPILPKVKDANKDSSLSTFLFQGSIWKAHVVFSRVGRVCKPFIVSAAVQTHGFYYNYSDHISIEMRSNMDYNSNWKKAIYIYRIY